MFTVLLYRVNKLLKKLQKASVEKDEAQNNIRKNTSKGAPSSQSTKDKDNGCANTKQNNKTSKEGKHEEDEFSSTLEEIRREDMVRYNCVDHAILGACYIVLPRNLLYNCMLSCCATLCHSCFCGKKSNIALFVYTVAITIMLLSLFVALIYFLTMLLE